MKVWPIDPLVPRNLRLEVPEKLPQGCHLSLRELIFRSVQVGVCGLLALHLVLGMSDHGNPVVIKALSLGT